MSKSKHAPAAPIDAEQPAEQPAAEPEQPRVFVALTQIGNYWQPGDQVAEAELLAIPGCDIDRLIRIGALREV